MLLLEGPKFARFSFYPPTKDGHDSEPHEHTPFTILGHRIVLAPPPTSPTANEDDSHTARTASSVWDCSIVLSKYLETLAVRHPGFWKSKRVLELGAGQGIVSMSAIALGAASVTITDLESALPTIADSLRLNQFPADSVVIHSNHDHNEERNNTVHTHVHLMGLDWMQHTRDLAKISARLLQDPATQHCHATAEVSATQVAPSSFPLDYILASDVVWVDYLIPSLVETMATLLGISVDESTTPSLASLSPPSSSPPPPQPKPWPVILLAHQTRSTRSDKILFDGLSKFGLAKKPIQLNHHHHSNNSNNDDKDPDEPALELEHVFQDPVFRKPNITLWKIWRTK
ncbi:hypothetical protein BGZ73_007977 [Actinomortierella ambigua]|nr:hypothetical protein BGZ73_007977 [Actinomortierella ambigua]